MSEKWGQKNKNLRLAAAKGVGRLTFLTGIFLTSSSLGKKFRAGGNLTTDELRATLARIGPASSPGVPRPCAGLTLIEISMGIGGRRVGASEGEDSFYRKLPTNTD